MNIQGDVDKSIIIVGDENTVEQAIYYVNVFSSIAVEKSTPKSSQRLNNQEKRARKVLISNVRSCWIEGVLRKSLHNQVVIILGLEERSSAVDSYINNVEELSDTINHTFPEGTQTTEVFDALGAGRTLVILGEPGAGKTITLLKLAESLLYKAENDLDQHVPVVLNLSSWSKNRAPIEQWLVEELYRIFRVRKALSKTWIEREQLILCLDGLDEVNVQYRSECVQALNKFLQTHGQTEIVVCSRARDYEALSRKLKVKSAIYVQPLTSEQIYWYLDKAGKQLSSLKEILSHDAEMRSFMTSPLILNIASLVYKDSSSNSLFDTSDPQVFRQQLFDRYIDSVLRKERVVSYTRYLTNSKRVYPIGRASHMLTYMAQHMVRSSRTTFSIEDIQPSWMHGKALKSKYLFIFSIIAVSCVILFLTASYTLVNMWVFSFLREELLDPIKILSDGVLVGLFFGLPISLFTIGAAFNDITTVETLNLSWKRVKEVLRQNLTVFGFGIMVAFVLSIGEIVKDISAENTATGVVLVVARTLASILIFSLFLYLVTSSMTISATIRGSAVNDKTVPNQGIWRTVLNASIATFTAGVVLTVLTSITQSLDQLPVYLPLITEVVALVSGGTSCMKHLSLRILLRLTGHAPWNYAQFLDYATERLLLQKVGGSYIFIHRTLLEHFSQLDSRLTSK